jgi:DNA (cytosine-5)-methyltransferase 1
MDVGAPKVFSFFSGSGFLDLGFEKAGFSIVYVNEYHAPFMDAYQYARAEMDFQKPIFGYDDRSIEDIKALELKNKLKTSSVDGSVVGFIGGPPCPDFSVGGKNKGKEGENGKLSQVYIDLICDCKPDFFLFENVKGLYRTAKHREFFDHLKIQLKESGYILHEKLINSIEYGAPQDRDRIILLGFKDKKLPKVFDWSGRAYPERTAFDFKWPDTNLFENDNSLPCPDGLPQELTVEYWFKKNDVLNHPNAKHCFTPRAGLARFLSVEEGDDSKKSYKRLHRWRYSPTAAYGNNEVHLHPYKPRRLSVAEALAIQSAPADFKLPPNMTLSNMFKTVGNGVPFLASLGLAKSIKEHLGKKNAHNSRKLGQRDKQLTT